MNKALLKMNVKSSYKSWIVFMIILLFYKLVIIGMYDPDNIEAMEEFMALMPEEFIRAIGYQLLDLSLAGYIGGYFYTFLVLMFPLIFTIMLSFQLVGKYVDDGSMAYLIATPHKRSTIIKTQAFFLLASILLMFLVMSLFGLVYTVSMFPGELDIGKYALLNLGTVCLYIFIAGLTFFCSTVFNETKHTLGLSIALPVGFLLVDMIKDVNDRLEFLRFFTPYSLFAPERIFPIEGIYFLFIFLLVLFGAILFAAAIRIFSRKNLTL